MVRSRVGKSFFMRIGADRRVTDQKVAGSMTFSVIYVALILILDACGMGTPFSWEDTAKVKPGMTEAEVVAIMGKPSSRSESNTESTLVWNYASRFGGSKAVAYRFANGRVVGNDTTDR